MCYCCCRERERARSGRDAGVSPALKEESSRKRDRSPVERDDRGVQMSFVVLIPILKKMCFASVLNPATMVYMLCIRTMSMRGIDICNMA